jgi:hypothetical protein
MALTDPKDSLAYHMARPLVRARNLTEVPAVEVAARISAFLEADTDPNTVPETEALWFYGMNHGMAQIRQAVSLYEPLGDFLPFVEAYHRELGPRAVRAFYYLLIICTREARHLKNKDTMKAKLAPVHGLGATDYLGIVPDHAHEAMKAFCQNPPDCTIGQFTGLLRDVFFKGMWAGAYGGPAWGQVADCLHRFVTGEFTAEMMLDVVWTLCHNNGPIFNKSMLYGGYTAQLVRILDVQRSGQVPALIMTDHGASPFAPVKLAQWMQALRAWFPDAIGTYVDWYLVEALGSVKKYPDEKIEQVKLHGPSPAAAKAEEIAKKKAAAAALAAEQAKQAQAKIWFTVMPGLKLKKIDREAA